MLLHHCTKKRFQMSRYLCSTCQCSVQAPLLGTKCWSEGAMLHQLTGITCCRCAKRQTMGGPKTFVLEKGWTEGAALHQSTLNARVRTNTRTQQKKQTHGESNRSWWIQAHASLAAFMMLKQKS